MALESGALLLGFLTLKRRIHLDLLAVAKMKPPPPPCHIIVITRRQLGATAGDRVLDDGPSHDPGG